LRRLGYRSGNFDPRLYRINLLRYFFGRGLYNGRFLNLDRYLLFDGYRCNDRRRRGLRYFNTDLFGHLMNRLILGSHFILRWTSFLVHSSDPKCFCSRNTTDDNLGSGKILLLITGFDALLGLHSGFFFTVCHEFLLIDTLHPPI
jgi:hypothetical protein